MSLGFIQIPRSLLNHASFISAPIAQKWLLVTIIQHACFLPCQIDDHQVLIELQPGQLCCSMRQLAEWANIEKNDVERGIERFSKVKILRHEVRHRKSIISITHTDTYDLLKQFNETTKETKVRQERDTKGYRDKEDTDEKNKKKLNKEKVDLPKIAIREWVSLSQNEVDKLFHVHGDVLANSMLDILDAYNTTRQKHYLNDYGALKKGGWVCREASKILTQPRASKSVFVDRRTKNIDGSPVKSPVDGRF